jgi:hypothetical protein
VPPEEANTTRADGCTSWIAWIKLSDPTLLTCASSTGARLASDGTVDQAR